MRKRIISALVLLMVSGLTLIGTGCGTQTGGGEDGYKEEIFAMDTQMSITAYGEKGPEAVKKSIEEIKGLDQDLAVNKKEGQIYKINKTGKGTAKGHCKVIIKRAIEINSTTGGAFDITVFPLVEKWGFISKDYYVPTDQEIDSILGLVGSDKIDFNQKTGEVSFTKEGMKIDLGGIAKGYTSSRVIEIMKECGVKSAIVSLGGNVQTLGGKPDGSPWRIAIKKPDDTKNIVGVVKVKDKAVVTSGGYERFFERDGHIYHHILNPATGKPADSGLTSVTIVSPDGTLSDGLSTALFVKGLEGASDYWREYKDLFDMIIIDDKGQVFVTETLVQDFSSDYPFEVIK